VKGGLSKYIPIVKAIVVITTKTANISYKYNKKINRNRTSLPRLIDPKPFTLIRLKLIYYTIEIAMHK
jgi:hypothetical protein